jgi:hypothetical protein
MTIADIDANQYMANSRRQTLLLVSMWGLYYILQVVVLQHYSWVPALLAFPYIMWRFDSLITMKEGYPRLTQLFTLVVALDLIGDGAYFIELALYLDLDMLPGYIGLGISAGGAVAVLFAHQWSQRQSDSLTVSFNIAMITSILMLGGGALVASLLFIYAWHKKVSVGWWLICPIHFIPTFTMLFYRQSLHMNLGKTWLRYRLGASDYGPEEIKSRWGELLSRVEHAIVGRQDLNALHSLGDNGEGYTLLTLACWANEISAVRRLLTIGTVDLDKGSDQRGVTPLLAAVRHGHTECVSILIAHGADVNKGDYNQQTPLFLASGSGQKVVIAQLMDAGATKRKWMGLTEEAAAISMRQISVVKIFRAYESRFVGKISDQKGCPWSVGLGCTHSSGTTSSRHRKQKVSPLLLCSFQV